MSRSHGTIGDSSVCDDDDDDDRRMCYFLNVVQKTLVNQLEMHMGVLS